MRVLTIAVVGASILWSSTSMAQAYFEDFESGDGGWFLGSSATFSTSLAPVGGVAGSTFLRGQRLVFRPNYNPISGDAAAALTGDLTLRYGTRFRVSYYTKNFLVDAVSGPLGHQLFSGPASDPTGTFWARSNPDPGVPSSEWTEVAFDIDADWTDGQAVANGWFRAAGTRSWSRSIRDVTIQAFVGGDCNRLPSEMPCPSTAWHETGLDDVSVTSLGAPVPSGAPTYLILLLATLAGIGGTLARPARVRHR